MKRVLVVAIAVCVMAPSTLSQETKATGGSAKSLFASEFLAQLKDLESKVVGLAEATPQEKFTWRPADGVRSVSEVYMHLAGSNFFIPTLAGVKAPEGFEREMEKTVTEKSKVLEMLKKSFAHIRDAAKGLGDAELAKPAKLFGRESTVEGVWLLVATHMHEHLGQSIAYARMNGVVPPWSRGEG